MRTVTKEVKDRKGTVLATIEVEQADSFDECVELAGGAKEAVELFNREWVTFQMNKNRPRKQGTGAAQLVKGFRTLSPEVQAALRDKSPEEIAALLSQLPV